MENCPYCKKEIDSMISTCPYCQKSIQPDYPSLSPKWFLGIWVFFLALMAVMLISMFGR